MALDPILAAYLADLRERGVPKVHEVPAEVGRQMFHVRARMMRELEPPPELAQVIDRSIPGPAGEIPIRIYHPQATGPLPTVLYAHGGGWVICDLDTHDAVCRRLADLAQCVVVAVDYRLAPEHPFPAGLHDTMAALAWLRRMLPELGGTHVWGLAGDSAGANLTSVAAHLLVQDDIDPDLPSPAAHLLIYPAVDAAGDYPSRAAYGVGFGLEQASIDYFVDLYAARGDLLDPRVSPLRFASHAGLPPSLVVTAGCDPLRDEGIAYIAALQEAGVPVAWQDAETLIHGFVDLGPMVPAAAEALARCGRAFGELLRAGG